MSAAQVEREVSQEGRFLHDNRINDLTFQRQVKQLWEMGPRVLAEFILELARRLGCWAIIREMLDEYTRLTPAQLAATDGDEFPARPLLLVPPDD